MTHLLNRPVLHERAVEQALEAMRVGSALRDHVLYSFVCVRVRLSEPYELAGQAALQVAVFDLLASVILDHLARVRSTLSLPAPDPAGADPRLSADFSQSNPELEAWSVLYARYVCVDRALSMPDIAGQTGVPERTLRRRLDRGLRRLTLQLVRMERSARHQHRQVRLRLAMPQSQPPALVGVDTLLPTVVHLLKDTDPPRHVLLHGPVGIGKTALALAAAHSLVDSQILDDLLWLALDGRALSVDALLNEMVVRLGLPAADGAAPAQMLRAYLMTHTVLIVLDGAEGIARASEGLLVMLDVALVMITSRVELPPEVWCSQVTIPELAYAHALELIDSGGQDSATQRTRWETAWSVAGGNPLALRVTWSALRHLPAQALGVAHSLGSLLDSVWAALPMAERQLLIAASLLHPAAMPYQMFGVLLDLPPAQLALAVSNLCQMVLLESNPIDQTMNYALPPMMASYVMELVREGTALEEEQSGTQWVGVMCNRMSHWLLSHPDTLAALHIVHVARRVSLPDGDQWALLVALAPQIVGGRLWHAWLDELRAWTDDRLSTSQQAWRDHQVGVALRWLGQLDDASAVFESLCARFTAPSPDHVAALVELSVVRRYQGLWDESFAYARSALEMEFRDEDDPGVERCIHELAQIAVDGHDASRALAWLSRLPQWNARAWGTASQAYSLLDHPSDAIIAAHRSLDLLPQPHPDRGRAMVIVANAYAAGGQFLVAVDYLTAALDLLDHAGDVIGYARCANNLAAVSFHLSGDRPISHERLRRLLTQALDVQRRCGDELGAAVSQDNLTRLAASGD